MRLLARTFGLFWLSPFLSKSLIRKTSAFLLLAAFMGVFSLGFAPSASAQAEWTLQSCIEYAAKNNLQAQQQQLLVNQAAINTRGARANYLPQVSADASGNQSYGFVIDPATNSIRTGENSTNTSFQFSASGSVPLFQGLANKYNLKQRQSEYSAARYTYAKSLNDLSLSVALAFVQVLFAEEQLDIAKSRLLSVKAQLARTETLVKAGSLAQTESLTLSSQVATEELNTVNAENSLATAKLNLQQQMNLPPTQNFEVMAPPMTEVKEVVLPKLEVIFNGAKSTLPDFKIADENVAAAMWSARVARARRYPSLSAFGGLNTRGSSSALEGVPLFGIKGTPYGQQLQNNFGQNLGLSLSIPILNNWSLTNNIALADLNIVNQRLQSAITAQTVEKNVQSAYLDVLSAQKKFAAVGAQTNSAQTSYDFAQKRYEAGLLNSVDLLNLQYQFTNAQADLLQAKYDMLFKFKVLDFYQGKPLTL